jgi:hypothetical protein
VPCVGGLAKRYLPYFEQTPNPFKMVPYLARSDTFSRRVPAISTFLLLRLVNSILNSAQSLLKSCRTRFAAYRSCASGRRQTQQLQNKLVIFTGN